MLNIIEERIKRLKKTNIEITRGDDATLVLPIFIETNGVSTPYTIQPGDTFALEVRNTPVKDNVSATMIMFDGTLSVDDGKLIWSISSTDTTQDAGVYYWDCQITTGGKVYTFYSGTFTILPEVTLDE